MNLPSARQKYGRSWDDCVDNLVLCDIHVEVIVQFTKSLRVARSSMKSRCYGCFGVVSCMIVRSTSRKVLEVGAESHFEALFEPSHRAF